MTNLSNGLPLLEHAGSISDWRMENSISTVLLRAYDQDRKQQEALNSDRQDEAELSALEDKIKRRLTQ